MRGAAPVPAVASPARTLDGTDSTAGADVRQRREARRQGAEHATVAATWMGDGHTPRKGRMCGTNAPLPRADSGSGRAGEVLPHSDKQRPRASAEPNERPASRKIVTGVPLELCTSLDHPLHAMTPNAVTSTPVVVAGSGQVDHTGEGSDVIPVPAPVTPTPADTSRITMTNSADKMLTVSAGDALGGNATLRRGGTPRSGRAAGEEGFETHHPSGRRRPTPQEMDRASPVHPKRGGGKGHHPQPAHHRWSATSASPLWHRNVLTHDGINIKDGHDTPVDRLHHHPAQHASSRMVPAPDTSKLGRDARQLGHHVPIVGSELLHREATGPPPPEAGHDAKPGRRQQRYGGHGHSIAHEMHPDGAGASAVSFEYSTSVATW